MSKRYVIYALVVGLVGGAYLQKKYSPIESSTVIKDRVITIVKEIVRPDGTKETNTRIEEDKNRVVLKMDKKDWVAGIGLDTKQVYTVEINRRILGPVFLGVYASTNQSLGVKAVIEF